MVQQLDLLQPSPADEYNTASLSGADLSAVPRSAWSWSVPLFRLRDSLDAVRNSLDDVDTDYSSSSSDPYNFQQSLADADSDLQRVQEEQFLQRQQQQGGGGFWPMLPTSIFGILVGVVAVVVAITGFAATRSFMPPFKRRGHASPAHTSTYRHQHQHQHRSGGGHQHQKHGRIGGAVKDQKLSRPIAGEHHHRTSSDDNLINLSPLPPTVTGGAADVARNKVWHQVPKSSSTATHLGTVAGGGGKDVEGQKQLQQQQAPRKSIFGQLFGSLQSSDAAPAADKNDVALLLADGGAGVVAGSIADSEFGDDDDDDGTTFDLGAASEPFLPPASLGTLNFQLGYSEKNRALAVKIDSCEQLNFPNGSLRRMNPYVKVELNADESSKQARTRLTRQTRNPIYNEEFTFYELRPALLKSGNVNIRFLVQSADRHARSQPIGQVTYSMGDSTVRRLCGEQTITMNNGNNGINGTTYTLHERRQLEPCSLDQAGGNNRPEVLLSLCWQNLGPAMRRLTVVVLKMRGGGSYTTTTEQAISRSAVSTTGAASDDNNAATFLRLTLGCVRTERSASISSNKSLTQTAPSTSSAAAAAHGAARTFERLAKKKTHAKQFIQKTAQQGTALDSTAQQHASLNFNESFVFDVSPKMLLNDTAGSIGIEQRMDVAALESLALIVEAFQQQPQQHQQHQPAERCIGQVILGGNEAVSSSAAIAQQWRGIISNPRLQSAEWFVLQPTGGTVGNR